MKDTWKVRISEEIQGTKVKDQPPPDAAYVLPKSHIWAASFLTMPKSTMKCPAYFESKPGLRPFAKHSLESTPQQQNEDVQGSHPADAAIWIGDLDGEQGADTEAQPLPLQLSSADTKAEVTDLDPGYGSS
nr:unnamed protein product [Spirometra erinaceieuropaei]